MRSQCVALVLLCGCGAREDGGSPGPADSPTGLDATLWSITKSVAYLRGIDTHSGEVEVDLQVAEGVTTVFSMAAGERQVWLGRNDGVVLAVEDGAIRSTQTLDDSTIEQVTLGSGSAYAALDSQEDPRIVRIDAGDFAVRAQAPVLGIGARFDSLAHDGSNLYVLAGNEFAAFKLNPMTLETEARVVLGYNPNDPGMLGEFGGEGFMVEVGASLWVVDLESLRLLRVDKRTMAAEIVSDLADLLEPEGYVELVSNSERFFLNVQAQDAVVGFDGGTGARTRTYSVADGVAHIAASEAALYIRPLDAPEEIRQIDIDSGATLRTFIDYPGNALTVE